MCVHVCVCVCLCVFCVGDVYQWSRPARWCSRHQGVLQCVAVRCSALQHVAGCCRVFAVCCSVLQCDAKCCSELQYVAVCVVKYGGALVIKVCGCAYMCVCVYACVCDVYQRSRPARWCSRHQSVLQCVAVCCSALQRVAACGSALHCVAMNGFDVY